MTVSWVYSDFRLRTLRTHATAVYFIIYLAEFISDIQILTVTNTCSITKMNLNSLHESLSKEVEKLVRWETEKIAHRNDAENQLRHSSRTIDEQEASISELEGERMIKIKSRKHLLNERWVIFYFWLWWYQSQVSTHTAQAQ